MCCVIGGPKDTNISGVTSEQTYNILSDVPSNKELINTHVVSASDFFRSRFLFVLTICITIRGVL